VHKTARYFARCAWILGMVAIGVWLAPGTTPAAVTPLTLLEQQMIKPNILLLLDNSTSMMNAPGGKDVDWNEVGQDCDNGDQYCRNVGKVGRCYFAGTGAMGAGVKRDATKCFNDSQCRVGYCKNKFPTACKGDADAVSRCSSSTAKCKGYCANTQHLATPSSCNQDSECPTDTVNGPRQCWGTCSNKTGTLCDEETDCDDTASCAVVSNDWCVKTTDKVVRAMTCRIGQQRCSGDTDCSSVIAGDTCGPGTSKMVIAKKVLAGVVSAYYKRVNFGLMTYYQKNYFPYYRTSGSIVDSAIVRWIGRDEIAALGCWTKKDGPSSTCTINGQTYNKRSNPDSRYQIKTGKETYETVESNWCGEGKWCSFTGQGTGYYLGSYYTYTDPQASTPKYACTSTDLTKCITGESCCRGACCRVETSYKGKTLNAESNSYVYWNPPTETRNVGNVYGEQGNPGDGFPTWTETASSPSLTSEDIGSVGATGTYSKSGTVYTSEGAGADIWGTADGFRFNHMQVTGDARITARVTSLENTNSFAKAGVMFRNALTAGSRNVYMLATPVASSLMRFTRRTVDGGTSVATTGASATLPHWVRLDRVGNTFTGYTSTDGETFTEVGSVSITMDATLYVGLAVTSHVAGTLATGVFDNVSIAAAGTPPLLTPLPLDSAGPTTAYCCATCGAGHVNNTIPFMDTTDDPTKAAAMVNGILAATEKAQYGGIGTEGMTRTGCALWNDREPNDTNNALSYLAKVKTTDTLGCRNNYVIAVTHGHSNFGNDTDCAALACAADDPTAAGCTCHVVLGAQKLKDAGAKVFMIGFNDATMGTFSKSVLNNVAKAGGTGSALLVVNETELRTAIVNVVYEAAKASYSTAPATSSAGVQKNEVITLGDMLLDTRVDFPGWRGNLIAYDGKASPPTVLWNAATVAFDYNVDTGKYFTSTSPVDRTGDWKKRNVWTSDGTTMVKITVDQSTGAITNKTQLKTLGMGATDAEAERVARWMMGDPALGNPAVVGGFINSTPIDIGPPGKSPMPGGDKFYNAHAGRPSLVYAGSSDGMIHAFFTRDTTVGSVTYKGGHEAFAYMPQTMLAVQLKLFAQGGQLPDPRDHVYGLANSPKVKSFCTANCTNHDTAVWKTQLVMTYGWGGTEAFMLDITNPFDSGGVKTATAPAPLLWSTQYLARSTTSAYDNELGLTTSVPAFYYGKSSTKDDFRVVFGSYTTEPLTGSIAKVLLNSSARNGAIVHDPKINPPNSCPQLFGLMSDVASARNHAVSEEVQIHGAYFGDTWGNLYRYVPNVSGASNYTGSSGTTSVVVSMTCDHPVHYAPTVIQLDRENASNHPNEIYLIQVTNSALDLVTKDYPPSQMVFRKDVASSPGVIAADTSFGTSGEIILTVGTSDMCGVTSADGGTCLEVLPAGARPNATPTAVVRGDGQGFVAIATWYLPAVDSCAKGMTYVTVHELNASTGTVKQKFGMKLASEPVTSTVFVGGKLLFAAQDGVTDLSTSLPPNLKFSTTVSGERFRRTGWSELP
jgi:hypothetical protein